MFRQFHPVARSIAHAAIAFCIIERAQRVRRRTNMSPRDRFVVAQLADS